MILEDKLQQFGLSVKQSIIYLASLRLGPAVATKIAQKANINRSTTYVILRELVIKGLIIQSEKNNKKIFSAVPPERFVSLMQFKAKQYKQMAVQAESILPELRSVCESNVNVPKVSIYEDKNGLEAAYEDTLTSSETILAYASIENMHKSLPHYFPEYYKRRARKKIHIKAIFPDTPYAKERHKQDKLENRTSLLVPKNKYDFSPEINIYDNKLAIFSWRDKLATIIESKELADAQKKIFELAWLEAKRLQNR